MGKQSEITQSSFTTTLYEAALTGNVNSLSELLKEDNFILQRCMIEKSCIVMQSPLHIAVEMGHLEFVKTILDKKPKLAEVVDQIKRSTPLHIAAAATDIPEDFLKGIVHELLEARPNTCFVHDQDGMTPLHVAAVYGNIKVLELLLEKKHQAALERTTRGETILHLCVKNNQLQTLEMLVESTYDLELLNSEDSDGNTVLHLAVTYKEKEMVGFLLKLSDDKIDKNAMNKKNKTIKDIFYLAKSNKKERKDMGKKDGEDNKLRHYLDKILRVLKIFKLMRKEGPSNDDEKIEELLKTNHTLRAENVLKRRDNEKWLEEQNTALMVVASCIATLSFQVGINPPGSVWQDNEHGHVAGTSIMSYDNNVDLYNVVQVSNTIGLMSSLSVILLLISGLPCKRHFVFILRVTLWIAITASATTYFFTVGYLTNELWDKAALVDAMSYSIEIWLWLMLVILFGHGLRFVWMLTSDKWKSKIKKMFKN